MKDFRLRNDTVLLFRNEPANDIMGFSAGKKVLFVYGGASVRQNGCYDDVKNAVSAGNGEFFELGGASRELKHIEKGLELVKQHGIEMIIGAGGASIMDCAKLIAFGAFHEENLWDYVK
ncbi:MAG: iron-containing alcohol dehydrogenase, partial [Lachnospiraceae bacterium]|nr:iron-containing alcohol dehydrogenase [Lachnospiraceae bacterium]